MEWLPEALLTSTCQRNTSLPRSVEAHLEQLFLRRNGFDIASLVLLSTSYQLVICYFFAIDPSIRKYAVRRKVVGTEGDQSEDIAAQLACQKAHHNKYIGSGLK
jgi:hypothetical protein